MDEPLLRQELGEQGHEYTKTQTVEKNSWRLWEAWTRAYEARQGKKTAAA
jgi:hypothetical protein